MSARRPSGNGPDTGRLQGGELPQRIGSAHDPAEPLPPGTQRYLTPAARQQQTASDGGQRQPGSGDARREQYGQHGSGAGQPSQFGGTPPQQHAGHGQHQGSPVRSGGTQDPRHGEEDDYAAPWGLYGGEYGQFDRSPSRQQAFGQQDLGFSGDGNPGNAGREGGHGPGSSQPWRGGDERGWQDPGTAGGHPYAPGQYGSGGERGPQGGADPAWRDHDTQGSQDWQGYSGGTGWQPGARGGWGGSPGRSGPPHQGRHGPGGGYGGGYGGGPGAGSSAGSTGPSHGAPQGGDGPRGYGEPRRPGAGGWPQEARGPQSASRGWSGSDAGPPVRDPSHDWGSRDAAPWGSRHRADDDREWSGADSGRSFDNPYGHRDGPSGPQLGEHQGSPYAGGRRGGIGQRAGGSGAAGGWDPSEHHGGRYGAQGFGASGRGGTGWSTPPGAGQPDNRPWDEQRSRHADRGPASWRGEAQGSGWRNEPGSGPSGDAQDGRGGRHGAHRDEPHEAHHGDTHHDPDYYQWRAEQLRNFDDDYRQWRQERYRRFSDEFNEWRQGRTRGGSSAEGSPTGGPDTTPGGAQGSTGAPGFRPQSASAGSPGGTQATPAGQPGQAHDVGVSGSTHAGSKADEQGAAQGRTLPSAGGESRETTGTSGGPGQAATPRDAGKPGKGKER